MPRVAITSVMPSATSISGAARLTMSTSAPYRWPSRDLQVEEAGNQQEVDQQQHGQRGQGPEQAVRQHA